MRKKIMLGCFEVPGWGGASTASYKLFEIMSARREVNYVNIIGSRDAELFTRLFGDTVGNPKQLPNVWNCTLRAPVPEPHRELADLIEKLSPEVMVGIGWIAALVMKKAAPARRLICVTSGCEQMKACIQKYGLDFLSFFQDRAEPDLRPCIESTLEWQAIKVSDRVITHSGATLALHRYFFPEFAAKIDPRVIWFAEWIYEEAREYSDHARAFSERDIDVMFVASNWSRPEKNYGFVKKLVSGTKDLDIHIVGQTEKDLAGAIHHGIVTDRRTLFGMLARAKTVVCPSLFDAAPGILFEASALGCNIVASKNCGNWQLCNEDLLAEPFACDVFLEKLRLAVVKPYQDHMARFLGDGSYPTLVEIIDSF